MFFCRNRCIRHRRHIIYIVSSLYRRTEKKNYMQKSFETVYLPVQPGNDMISVSFFRLFRVMRLVKLLSKGTTTPQLSSNSIPIATTAFTKQEQHSHHSNSIHLTTSISPAKRERRRHSNSIPIIAKTYTVTTTVPHYSNSISTTT